MTKTKTITTATTKDGTRVTTNPEAEFEVSRGLSSYRLLIVAPAWRSQLAKGTYGTAGQLVDMMKALEARIVYCHGEYRSD